MTPQIREIAVGLIYGNPDQPRQEFDDDYLAGLADSIRENGLLQPIKVTTRGDRFMIVLGECRYRAHLLIGAPTIKCLVEDDMADVDVMVEAIVENGQRRDVKPIEEAVAYQRCLDGGVSLEDLARRLGLQQTWRITERTCLLKLRPEYQQLARSGQLTTKQAYHMAQLAPASQDQLFKAINRGECEGRDQLRSAALLLQHAEAQTSFLDDEAPSDAQRQLAKSLEHRVGQVIKVLRASTVDNEIVAVKKVDPNRAGTLADMIAAMRGDLVRIEAALRAAAQPELANAA